VGRLPGVGAGAIAIAGGAACGLACELDDLNLPERFGGVRKGESCGRREFDDRLPPW
jgi:hypothetical protein